MSDERPLRVVSRRDLLKAAGGVGAAALSSRTGLPAAAEAAEAAEQAVPAGAPAREALEHLTAEEADLLDAMVARLIPTDALGPGAREARAVRYIDRALGGALSPSRQAYATGLAALDRFARVSRGRPFLELSAAEQDSVLVDVESGKATATVGANFSGSSAQFFAMVLGHTRQGTFGDPYYGGNANFVGWDLLQFPGVRTMVTAADQQAMEKGQLKPNRRSAYDFDGFNKATVQADPKRGHHAD